MSYLFFSKLSPIKALGLSIGIAIVSNFLAPAISLIPSNLVYYSYPTSFALSLLSYSLTLSYPINPAISALVETAWVVVILGYLLFKKVKERKIFLVTHPFS